MSIEYIHRANAGGGVTLAVERTAGGMFEVGAAFCSPLEREFSRKKGRRIALGRLRARRHGFVRTPVNGLRRLSDDPRAVGQVLSLLSSKAEVREDDFGERRRTVGPRWWRGFMVALHREQRAAQRKQATA